MVKKVVFILALVISCVALLVMPVFAEAGFTWLTITPDDWNGVAVYEPTGAAFSESTYVIPGTDNGNNMEFNLAATEDPLSEMRFSTGFNVPIELGVDDVLVIEKFNVGGWFGGLDNTITDYCLALHNDGKIVRMIASYSSEDVEITSRNDYGVTYSLWFDQIILNLHSSLVFDEVVVYIHMFHSAPGLLSFSRKQVTIGYGPYEAYLTDTTNGKLDETNNKLDGIQGEQEETNEKLDDLIGQPEQEKQEATNEGDSNVGALKDVVPDYSGDVLDALSSVFQSLSYEGTKATFTFPRLYIPAIKGLWDNDIELTKATSLDLASYALKLPSTILAVMRIIFGISLLLYCVFEIYSLFEFVFTAVRSRGKRGGGG